MAKILEMPKLSPTMEEGVLSAWHKNEGDAVNVDDLLAEVETDKATMEFRAFDKGTLLKLLVAAGAHVKLGQPVAILGTPGEDVSSLLSQLPSSAPSAAPATPALTVPATPSALSTPTIPSMPTSPSIQEAPRDEASRQESRGAPGAPIAEAPRAPRDEDLRMGRKPSALERTEFEPEPPEGAAALASPFIRKQAREKGIDLKGAQGTGPHGRLIAQDLDSMSRALVKPATVALQKAESESRPLSMMRKTIARRLTESKQTVPHFYLTIEVDAAALTTLRETVNAELAAEGTKISINDLLIKACALALVRVPEANATFTPEALLIHKRVDISVAVAVPDGLVTPVVRDADKKSVVAIAKEVRDLAARAKQKKLKPEEMMDGTFSISNLGMFGIESFSAVINPPEGAILAVGHVRDEPVVKEGQIVAGKKLAMTLSCDHRVIDGALGASFLAELRALIEHPMLILTG